MAPKGRDCMTYDMVGGSMAQSVSSMIVIAWSGQWLLCQWCEWSVAGGEAVRVGAETEKRDVSEQA